MKRNINIFTYLVPGVQFYSSVYDILMYLEIRSTDNYICTAGTAVQQYLKEEVGVIKTVSYHTESRDVRASCFVATTAAKCK